MQVELSVTSAEVTILLVPESPVDVAVLDEFFKLDGSNATGPIPVTRLERGILLRKVKTT